MLNSTTYKVLWKLGKNYESLWNLSQYLYPLSCPGETEILLQRGTGKNISSLPLLPVPNWRLSPWKKQDKKIFHLAHSCLLLNSGSTGVQQRSSGFVLPHSPQPWDKDSTLSAVWPGILGGPFTSVLAYELMDFTPREVNRSDLGFSRHQPLCTQLLKQGCHSNRNPWLPLLLYQSCLRDLFPWGNSGLWNPESQSLLLETDFICIRV